MPYTTQADRAPLDPKIDALQPETAGDLNYAITRLCHAWFKRNGGRYLQVAIVMGTFICAAFEFYRRVASPYEDRKIAENGDVYTEFHKEVKAAMKTKEERLRHDC